VARFNKSQPLSERGAERNLLTKTQLWRLKKKRINSCRL